MRASDPFSSLAAEFRALPSGERRSVYRALSPAERVKLKALLDCVDAPPRPRAAETDAALSPCLRARLEPTGEDEAESRPVPWRMTASGRRLLEEAVRDSRGRDAGSAPARPTPPTSLTDALVGLVSPRRWAR